MPWSVAEAMSEYEIDQVEAPQPSASHPFQIQLASRVYRLPPYMFGRINHLLYEKRRAGNDVIDLGMGNPSDPPEDLVIEKLAAAATTRQPRLQQVERDPESAA